MLLLREAEHAVTKAPDELKVSATLLGQVAAHQRLCHHDACHWRGDELTVPGEDHREVALGSRACASSPTQLSSYLIGVTVRRFCPATPSKRFLDPNPDTRRRPNTAFQQIMTTSQKCQ